MYRTFSETHLIEIVDTGGRPVAVGARGDVVVTQFEAWAAPIIRYRVGDRATYRGWEQGRVLLSDIERPAEAAIGSTLVPYRDLVTWTPRLAARCGPWRRSRSSTVSSPGGRRSRAPRARPPGWPRWRFARCCSARRRGAGGIA